MPDRSKHVQSREHACVSTPEVTKVVVRRVLTAEDRVVLRHGGFHESGTHSPNDDLAALGQDDLRHNPGGDLVADDDRTWLTGQLLTGDHRRDYRRTDHGAALVDDETAICVAVEYQSKISCILPDRRLCIEQV